MDFSKQPVNNLKNENEKTAQKRQFCFFALENVICFLVLKKYWEWVWARRKISDNLKNETMKDLILAVVKSLKEILLQVFLEAYALIKSSKR